MSLPDKMPTQATTGCDANAVRKQWVAPCVTELPKLKNLTLQTGGSIGGGPSVIP